MNVGETLKTALGGLVGSRVYPNKFPQPPAAPVWPAIRYTVISREPDQTIDGTDDGESDDIRVQLDIVAIDYATAKSLRDQAWAALSALSTPCVRIGENELADVETKTQRFILDIQFHPSTSAGSPD